VTLPATNLIPPAPIPDFLSIFILLILTKAFSNDFGMIQNKYIKGLFTILFYEYILYGQMKIIILNIINLLAVACLLFSSCSGNQRLEDVPYTEYRGFIIQERRGILDIRKSLDFIMTSEPQVFRLLKKYVRKIEYSPYHYNRSYPYYDVVNISQFSLERGEVHSASVLLHELFHIVLSSIRRNSSRYGADEKTFLLKAGIKYDDIKDMKKKREERAASLLQYSFIRKHGSVRDVDYQRQKLEKLGIPPEKNRR
jgi:hypothetical protein